MEPRRRMASAPFSGRLFPRPAERGAEPSPGALGREAKRGRDARSRGIDRDRVIERSTTELTRSPRGPRVSTGYIEWNSRAIATSGRTGASSRRRRLPSAKRSYPTRAPRWALSRPRRRSGSLRPLLPIAGSEQFHLEDIPQTTLKVTIDPSAMNGNSPRTKTTPERRH